MYKLLIKVMVAAALVQLGLSISKFESCHSRQCAAEIEKASRDILRVEWKPISVFPEEANRFK